ncbi:MAG: hypothetical protein OEN56_14500 [Gemmatimonadota bacterium]|nr:hypothetical protein [Gemmatimonadota bacterium]
MGKNRLETFLRDPTLEKPTADHFRVRLQWQTLHVTRESATRILAAIGGRGPPKFVRCQTVTGSVVFVRTDMVLLVEESTKAQRASERRFWKELDEEEDQDEQTW